MEKLFTIAAIIMAIIVIMDGSIVYLIVKERLWRDDNAVLILNLMIGFMIHCVWQMSSLTCDTFQWPFPLPLILVLEIIAHVAILLTLVFLSSDRYYARKKKTLVKIYCREYAGKRVWRIHHKDYVTAVSNGTVNDRSWQKTHIESRRLTLTVAALVFGQCTTWVPIYVYMIVARKDIFDDPQNPIFVLLLFANFLAAPILIYLFSKQFRLYFKRHFLCCLYPDSARQQSWIDLSMESSRQSSLQGRSSPIA
ncbi:hypothetical protein HOLleu_23532 [Holothuria leucospilota]|uniref:G-protein coupled receptors family 1 profile domain-containing protein n=1 Tax=Holothuria leucospilota TaxID=206669 RepID=A0A9Q1H4U6_HOLLE|nr:hypothetical protein HOLleu_23532 [Holothuria leucospilota]